MTVRTDIRDGAKSALVGNTAAGSNIFLGQGYDLDRSVLPAIQINCSVERNDEVDASGVMGYQANLSVVAIAEGNDADAVVAALEVIEGQAIALIDGATLLAGTLTAQYTGTEVPSIDDAAEKLVGRMSFSFATVYRAAPGDHTIPV